MSKKKNIGTGRDSGNTSETQTASPSESLWRPLYPFTSRYARIGGFNLHYVDEGPTDANGNRIDSADRPTLLLVHGNPTWSFFWRNVIKGFQDRYRVIAVDHIGCGLSDKPPVKDYPYTLDRRISDLSNLVQKLNLQNVVLIGHDWGGLIGMGAAQRTPKRFCKIVLLNTAAFRSDTCPLRIRICRMPLIGKLIMKGMNVFPRAALKMASNAPGGLSREVRAGMLAPYDCWANRVAVYQFVQDIPLSEKDRSWNRIITVEQELPLFRDVPVALVWGMQDWCFNGDYLKKFLQYYPTAFVHRIENAGHYVVEDAPDEVIDVIGRFIEGNATSTPAEETK